MFGRKLKTATDASNRGPDRSLKRTEVIPPPGEINGLNHERDVRPAVMGGGERRINDFTEAMLRAYPFIFLLLFRLTGKCFYSI